MKNTSFKNCQVVMIPTGKPVEIGQLLLVQVENESVLVVAACKEEVLVNKAQELYILSKEEIRDGDYAVKDKSVTSHGEYEVQHINLSICTQDLEIINQAPFWKKVIATKADCPESFIDEYLEAYNDGQPITDVIVEYDISLFKGNGTYGTQIPVNIKKVEPMKVVLGNLRFGLNSLQSRTIGLFRNFYPQSRLEMVIEYNKETKYARTIELDELGGFMDNHCPVEKGFFALFPDGKTMTDMMNNPTEFFEFRKQLD